jgi:hypothetical protein
MTHERCGELLTWDLGRRPAWAASVDSMLSNGGSQGERSPSSLMGGNLVAGVTACAAPERGDLCAAMRMTDTANRRPAVADRDGDAKMNSRHNQPGAGHRCSP